jgi:UPF0755 protein
MSFVKAIFSIICVLAILVAAALAGGYIWLQNEITKPGPAVTEQVFVVMSGEGLGQIANRLETQGLIRDNRIMRAAARLEDANSKIKAGEYRLAPGLSVSQTLARLVEGKAIQYKITVPEGRTVAQAFRLIEANDLLVGELPEELPPEGSLLPDTYFFGRGMSRVDLVAQMTKAQDDLLTELWETRQEGLPFSTPEEAIILASIVEKETGRLDEQPQVAGLFVGRLKRGMRLQSDPTIIYAVSRGEPLRNERTGKRRRIRRSEIDAVNDWNTYQIDGLPKTAICNPGRNAIAAVLDPPSTEYVFFVADGKGGHLFATTNAEHERNVALYRKYEREELARERAEEQANP